jgi:hypothetical protein
VLRDDCESVVGVLGSVSVMDSSLSKGWPFVFRGEDANDVHMAASLAMSNLGETPSRARLRIP